MAKQSEVRPDGRMRSRGANSKTPVASHHRTDPNAEAGRPQFAYAPGAPVAGNPVLFEADESDRRTDARYEWAFGDGATATGRKASHVYETPGEHVVRLTVGEGDESRTVRKTVTVYREVDVTVGDRDEDGLLAVTLHASEGFDPADAVAVDSLRVGAPTALAAGGGASPVRSESRDGDLRVRIPAAETRLREGDARVRVAGHTTDHVPVAGTVDPA